MLFLNSFPIWVVARWGIGFPVLSGACGRECNAFTFALARVLYSQGRGEGGGGEGGGTTRKLGNWTLGRFGRESLAKLGLKEEAKREDITFRDTLDSRPL